ncbi:MAG: hypothetical protein U5L72_16165 [Bacteroidales bacterium]|nr:hypothetical protein [Bacteroidales bacterium]
MKRNVIVAQSGGPSPVINNTLRGIIDSCLGYPDNFGKIYGGWHGIEGVLKGRNCSTSPPRIVMRSAF